MSALVRQISIHRQVNRHCSKIWIRQLRTSSQFGKSGAHYVKWIQSFARRFVNLVFTEKGIPVESQGRKATGLRAIA